jgi:hypothetical protein
MASVPRKWSILNIALSAKTVPTSAFNRLADARSRPNGFSMMTRLRCVSSAAPRPLTTGSKSAGGIAR